MLDVDVGSHWPKRWKSKKGDGTYKGVPSRPTVRKRVQKSAQNTKSWLHLSQRSQKLPRKQRQLQQLPGAQLEEAFEALRRATNKSVATEMAKHRHDKEKGPSSQIDVGRPDSFLRKEVWIKAKISREDPVPPLPSLRQHQQQQQPQGDGLP